MRNVKHKICDNPLYICYFQSYTEQAQTLLLWSSVSYSNISLRFRTLTWYILWYQYRGIHKKRYPQTVRVRPRVILRLSKGQVSQRTSRSQANHHYFSSTQVGKLMLSTTCATWATSTTCALLEKRDHYSCYTTTASQEGPWRHCPSCTFTYRRFHKSTNTIKIYLCCVPHLYLYFYESVCTWMCMKDSVGLLPAHISPMDHLERQWLCSTSSGRVSQVVHK